MRLKAYNLYSSGIFLLIYRTSAERPAWFADVGSKFERLSRKLQARSITGEKARLYAAGSRHVEAKVDAAAENLSSSKATAGKSSMYFGNFLDTRTDTRIAQASSALEMKVEEVSGCG